MPPPRNLPLLQWLQLIMLLTASSQLLVCSSEELTKLSFYRNAQINGEILAYVDFDADGWIDFIALEAASNSERNKQSNEQLIRLHLWEQEASVMVPSIASSHTLLRSTDLLLPGGGQAVIEATSVADFNGDALPDLLISVRDNSTDRLRLWIAYGQTDRQSVGQVAMVTEAVDQPTLFDYNADLVTDFLVEVAPGKPVVFCGRHKQLSFTNYTDAFPGLSPQAAPNANLFVDLNADLRSDMLLRVVVGPAEEKFVLLSASAESGGFKRQTGLSAFALLPKFLLAKELKHSDNHTNSSNGSKFNVAVGPPEPMSADSDAGVDLALPVCLQEFTSDSVVGLKTRLKTAAWRCSSNSSAVWIYSSGAAAWCRVGVDGLGSSFALHPELPSSSQLLLRLRAADFDLDGRQDLVCLLRRLSDGALVPGLLRSVSDDDSTPTAVDCASGASASSFRFRAEELPLLAACQAHISEGGQWALAAVAPAELDLDGSPDLLTLCRHPTGAAVSRTYSQVHSQPGNFFRIQSLNSARCWGRSQQSCTYGRLPQGLPAPGPCVQLSIERRSGGHRAETACQLAQSSAHGRLPLPEMHFGLGQYSNYIERLTVAVPDNVPGGRGDADGPNRRQQDFGFIMPNSLLLVAPRPPDQPHKWLTWLIVRPFSHPHVWGVGLAFLLASGLAFAVAGVLQFVEYRRDKADRAAASPAGFMFDPH
ncbi:hypothetical protein BOX15_Mlig011226g2 [Macrostomum lignano]|uniref:T-cell immunomodulatory protein TIP C2 domain-containing protein n=1 Tax=Macrostomum lignano TaxID=282301 RepID=A0A267E4I1_9PLAT|nr:hypothetical protein BOX15_Mlig011226g2 [Macrostomum lignano]